MSKNKEIQKTLKNVKISKNVKNVIKLQKMSISKEIKKNFKKCQKYRKR